jgi:hypothetical protein
MIFQQYHGHLLVVRQPDHGVQTGLFASHWGTEETRLCRNFHLSRFAI